jgi:hypothetical protein
MTPDQVNGFFDAGESFVEGTITAVLVMLWLVVLALHLARPYMLRTLNKFTLRLGADLWWIVYVAVRDILTIQIFLGSRIFFYPDVVRSQQLPITGGLAAVCAFAALLIKLISRGDADVRGYRTQIGLLGLGTALYFLPFVFGVQLTLVGGDSAAQISSLLVSSSNTDVALPLCYLSAALVGVMAATAVIYNLRQASGPARKPVTEGSVA